MTKLVTSALAVPAVLRNANFDDTFDELTAGVASSIPVLSFRGKVFRVRQRGVETVWIDPFTSTSNAFTGVLVKANKHLSKAYYAKAYVQGSIDPPACWSVDGVRPDASILAPVHPVCATCPKNAFGSRSSGDQPGTLAKACGDFRLVAVLPSNDLDGKQFEGPLLLRVPPASLNSLSSYAAALRQAGVPYFGVLTRIVFSQAEFPQLEFVVAGALSDEDAAKVLSWRDSERTAAILSAGVVDRADAPAALPAPAPAPAPASAEPTEPAEPAEAAEPVSTREPQLMDIDALLERAAADLAKRKRARATKAEF